MLQPGFVPTPTQQTFITKLSEGLTQHGYLTTGDCSQRLSAPNDNDHIIAVALNPEPDNLFNAVNAIYPLLFNRRLAFAILQADKKHKNTWRELYWDGTDNIRTAATLEQTDTDYRGRELIIYLPYNHTKNDFVLNSHERKQLIIDIWECLIKNQIEIGCQISQPHYKLLATQGFLTPFAYFPVAAASQSFVQRVRNTAEKTATSSVLTVRGMLDPYENITFTHKDFSPTHRNERENSFYSGDINDLITVHKAQRAEHFESAQFRIATYFKELWSRVPNVRNVVSKEVGNANDDDDSNNDNTDSVQVTELKRYPNAVDLLGEICQRYPINNLPKKGVEQDRVVTFIPDYLEALTLCLEVDAEQTLKILRMLCHLLHERAGLNQMNFLLQSQRRKIPLLILALLWIDKGEYKEEKSSKKIRIVGSDIALLEFAARYFRKFTKKEEVIACFDILKSGSYDSPTVSTDLYALNNEDGGTEANAQAILFEYFPEQSLQEAKTRVSSAATSTKTRRFLSNFSVGRASTSASSSSSATIAPDAALTPELAYLENACLEIKAVLHREGAETAKSSAVIAARVDFLAELLNLYVGILSKQSDDEEEALGPQSTIDALFQVVFKKNKVKLAEIHSKIANPDDAVDKVTSASPNGAASKATASTYKPQKIQDFSHLLKGMFGKVNDLVLIQLKVKLENLQQGYVLTLQQKQNN